MQRAIVQPAALAGEALAELKQWLGISSAVEDAQLTGLLRSSLEMCEGFTGQVPLETGFEEFVPLARGWSCLATRPVRAITGLQLVSPDGLRSAIAPSDYELDIAADGTGRFRLHAPTATGLAAVAFVAGIAASWDAMPDALRHGVLRLAAHGYRDRGDGTGGPTPPASIAALWRPWRRLRIA